MIAGTLAYMAPEQKGRMNCSVDAHSDLYSLGVVLYEMLTGVLPFSAAAWMDSLPLSSCWSIWSDISKCSSSRWPAPIATARSGPRTRSPRR
jgi:serine/threonine protein kinase